MNQVAVMVSGVFTILGLGIFLIWLAFRYARRSGAAAAERDQYQTKTEQARKANEIDEDVSRLSDSAIDSELYDRR